jgi:hypothetical protein
MVLALFFLSASGLAACNTGPVLELEVFNGSAAVVVVEVLGPGGADVGFRQVLRPDHGFKVAVERPGPGGWAVSVDGQVATSWEDWPNDNPVIDLFVDIRRDGSVDVQDAPRPPD